MGLDLVADEEDEDLARVVATTQIVFKNSHETPAREREKRPF